MFGGVFDPPHLGHVTVAREAAWQLGLREVRIVVCARPAHRGRPPVQDPETRFAMVAAACTPYPELVPSRLEIERPGPSYTVDTLTDLVAAEPGVDVTLIIGADQLLGFGRWREPARIVELARLAVVARDEADATAVAEAAEAIAPGGADLVAMPAMGVSSTLIRDRLASGTPVAHLLPAPVGELIARRGLYGCRSPLP